MYFRRRFLIIITILTISMLFAGFTAHAQSLGDRTLYYGMRGEDVREAQSILKQLSFFSANPTGYFGPITRQSVRDFQSRHGLQVDGIIGVNTTNRLKQEINRNSQTGLLVFDGLLRQGMRSSSVTALQNALAQLGYFNVNATGYFGSITYNSVTRFQRDKSLLVDGIVGRNTINAINNELQKLNTVGSYTVQRGDSLWLIANKYKITIDDLMRENGLTSTTIYVGQVLKIPSSASPDRGGNTRPPTEGSKPYVTYTTYTVVSGDNIWNIAQKFGIPANEVMQANNLNQNSVLRVGQQLSIPVHHIPVQPTVSPRHGEHLDWWTEAQYLWPIGKVAEIEDFHTGRRWKMKRTYGAFHADVEPLTTQDTSTMLSVWGGRWSWLTRPILVHIDGRKIAASAYAMPHSVQKITNNNFNGHTCIHFKNSTRHRDNQIDPSHQNSVRIAAGVN